MEKTAKEKLIKVALEKFSKQGFDGVSTREIVKEARVNISAITYYFESKEGLYKACFEYVANFIKEGTSENFEQIIPLVKNNQLKEEEYRPILHKVLSNITRFICGSKVPSHIVNLVIREQLFPSENLNNIYKDLILPMHETMTLVFARITNQNPNDKKVILEAHSLIGQIFIFRTHQDILAKRLNEKKDISEDVVKIVLKHTDAILDSYIENSGENQ